MTCFFPLVQLGETPYPDVEINTVKAFIQHLKDGNRLPRPDGCPESM